MVPLRLDVCDDRPRSAGVRPRPQLVLKDLTADRPAQNSPVAARRSPFHSLETVLLAAAAAAVLLYFFFIFTLSLVHSVQQSYVTPAQPSVVLISKTVARGDTLARLARRYGDPNTYILAREEQIARANHLVGTAPLFPASTSESPSRTPPLSPRSNSSTAEASSRDARCFADGTKKPPASFQRPGAFWVFRLIAYPRSASAGRRVLSRWQPGQSASP